MAVMTSTGSVVRVSSDAPVQPALLIPVQRSSPSIAAALPIHRDHRARRACRGSTRRLTMVAVAFGVSLLTWLAIFAAIMIVARVAR